MDGDSGVISLSNSLNDIAIDFDEKSLSGVSVSQIISEKKHFQNHKTFHKNQIKLMNLNFLLIQIADVYPLEDYYRRKSIEPNSLTKILQRPSMEELHLGRGISTTPNASVSTF